MRRDRATARGGRATTCRDRVARRDGRGIGRGSAILDPPPSVPIGPDPAPEGESTKLADQQRRAQIQFAWAHALGFAAGEPIPRRLLRLVFR